MSQICSPSPALASSRPGYSCLRKTLERRSHSTPTHFKYQAHRSQDEGIWRTHALRATATVGLQVPAKAGVSVTAGGAGGAGRARALVPEPRRQLTVRIVRFGRRRGRGGVFPKWKRVAPPATQVASWHLRREATGRRPCGAVSRSPREGRPGPRHLSDPVPAPGAHPVASAGQAFPASARETMGTRNRALTVSNAAASTRAG